MSKLLGKIEYWITRLKAQITIETRQDSELERERFEIIELLTEAKDFILHQNELLEAANRGKHKKCNTCSIN